MNGQDTHSKKSVVSRRQTLILCEVVPWVHDNMKKSDRNDGECQ